MSLLASRDSSVIWLKRTHSPGKGKGLASLLWKRIVLDEAHVIRNPKTKTTIAVCALEAERRWFVSATPLQNTITDLYSAFLFLRFQPYRLCVLLSTVPVF